MAKGFGSKRPQYSISTSVFIRKGKYKQGVSFGLWDNDGKGPMARGSVKGEYLSELAEFLQKASDNDMSVSFALFKNKSKKRDEEDDEDDDDEEDDEKDTSDDEEDEEEDEEEKSSSKKSKKKSSDSDSKRGSKGKKGKKGKGDWDFD